MPNRKPQTPVRRTRLLPDDRRQEILAVAEELMAAHGYRGITVERVATGCGVSKAGLLHHFPSKEAILVGLLERRDESDLQALRGGVNATPTKGALRAALSELVKRNASRPGLIRLYAVLAAEALDPGHPAHAYFTRRRNDSRRILQELAAPWHSNPSSFAVQVLSFMDGLQLNWLGDPTIGLTEEWELFAHRLFADS